MMRDVRISPWSAITGLCVLALASMGSADTGPKRVSGRPDHSVNAPETGVLPPRLITDPADIFGADIVESRSPMRGRVRVAVLVDNKGAPLRCAILKGSGEALLDQSTCGLMLRKARFAPARDRKGRAVAGVYRSPTVHWKLADEN